MDKTLGLRSFVAKSAPQDDNRGLVDCWTSGKAGGIPFAKSAPQKEQRKVEGTEN